MAGLGLTEEAAALKKMQKNFVIVPVTVYLK